MPLRLATITEGSDLVHHSLLVHHGLKTPFKIEEALRRLRMDGMEGRQLGRSLDALHRYRKADAAKKAEMLLHESGLMALLLLTSFDDEAISSYSNLPTPKLELDLSGSIRCTGEGAVVISLIEVKRELNVQGKYFKVEAPLAGPGAAQQPMPFISLDLPLVARPSCADTSPFLLPQIQHFSVVHFNPHHFSH